MRTKAVPQPKPKRRCSNAEQPQLPDGRAVAEHVSTVANSFKGTGADIDAVGDKAESGKESNVDRAAPPHTCHDGPSSKRDRRARIGPAQATTSGNALWDKSVREIVDGCKTTLATRPPVNQAPTTCPSSWTAIIPSHDTASIETHKTSRFHRPNGLLSLIPIPPVPSPFPARGKDSFATGASIQ